MKLYRPVGLYEMEKILNNNGRNFPPRFDTQPFFYPVLNRTYAKQIAKDWNTIDANSGFVGFITEFEIDDIYISQFTTHQVGGNIHLEYWIPAENLNEFNKNIKSAIKIVKAYYGMQYIGINPTCLGEIVEGSLSEQIKLLKNLSNDITNLFTTVLIEWKLINLNYFYWLKDENNKDILTSITECLEINRKKFIITKTS